MFCFLRWLIGASVAPLLAGAPRSACMHTLLTNFSYTPSLACNSIP